MFRYLFVLSLLLLSPACALEETPWVGEEEISNRDDNDLYDRNQREIRREWFDNRTEEPSYDYGEDDSIYEEDPRRSGAEEGSENCLGPYCSEPYDPPSTDD